MKTPTILIKFIIVASLILSSQFSQGRNYYFSSSIGDDSRTSLQAQNPATPWKTITKLNSFFSSLSAGDSILFKNGDIFSETIIPAISGTLSSPIVISSYGSGPKPVISGFQTVTGWTSEGGGIYSKAITVQSTPNMVTVNGVNTPKGRYPNADAANAGYLTVDSHVANTSITDAAMPSTTYNWTGAELVMKVTHWVFNRAPITNHSGTTIAYTSSTTYNATNGYGYFIQQDNKVLDRLGEWTYLNGKLYMYFGAANPHDYTVKVSVIDKLVYASARNYLTIENISFQGANVAGIHFTGTSYNVVRNCDFNFSGYDAVRIERSHYPTISYCRMDQSQNSAFEGGSWGAFSDHVTFSHNTITNTYQYPGMSSYADGKGFTVSSCGDNTLIEYNRIINSGYIGISTYGANTIVRYNYIDNVCTIKDDGGGIYTGVQSNITIGPITIENNVVINAIGNSEGTTSTTPEAFGIYIDGYGNHVTVQNNTVTNATNAGIFLGFYTHHINVLNNTLVDNASDLFINHQISTTGNYIINGNIFATTGTDNLVKLTASSMSIASLGTWSGNYFIKPFDDKGVVKAEIDNPKTVFTGFSVDGWKIYDATAHGSPVTITPYTVDSLIGSNKFANGTFTSNTTGADYYYSGTASMSWDNSNKIDGGSIKVSYTKLSTTNSRYQLKLSVGALKANTKYILKYDILGSNANKSVGVFLKYSVFYTEREKYYPYTNSVSHVETILEPNAGAAAAELYFEFNDSDGTAYIDNVEFYEANVIKANPDDFIRFEYNETQTTKTIVLDEAYLGVDSTLYSGSITLLPYTSIVLIKNAVISANHIPTIQNQNFQLNENKPNGSVVGTVVASDQDAGQTLSYSILSGNTNEAFAINASTGILTIANSAAVNYEVSPYFTLAVNVQDNGTGNLSSQATITINILSTGIGVNEIKQKIKVYPNPVSDELNIDIEGITDNPGFEISNSIGQIVFEGNLSERTVVQTTNFSSGIYLIKFDNGKTIDFKKIMKK